MKKLLTDNVHILVIIAVALSAFVFYKQYKANQAAKELTTETKTA
jgi:hypothetical protein